MSRSARVDTTEPLVSVLMVNRNHEDTLAEAITSVLSQTHKNLRLIIVDDGSTDSSVEVAKTFLADPRVELHALPRNVHICAATNVGLELVRGEWLARIDSDDVWYPNRLERQLEVLAQHPGQEICFAWADWIDEDGNDIRDQVAALAQSCDAAFATQREWLRKFYYEGNCLLHSSVLIRTSLVREVGGFDLAYRQLHDFDYWVRVAKTRNILVVPERLIAMRHFTEARNEGRNSSNQSLDNVTRTFNEYADIRAHFFEGMPDNVLVDAFGEDFRRANSRTPEELACERAFLLCRPQDEWNVPAAPAGLRALRELLAQEPARRLLEERYDFPAKSLYALTSSHVYNDPLLRATAALEKDALYGTIDSLEREIDSLRAHVHVLEAVLGQKDAALGQRDAALGEKDAQVQELLGRIGAMEASSSWRVTGPLRSLSRARYLRVDGAGTSPAGGSPAGAGKTVYVHAFLAANLWVTTSLCACSARATRRCASSPARRRTTWGASRTLPTSRCAPRASSPISCAGRTPWRTSGAAASSSTPTTSPTSSPPTRFLRTTPDASSSWAGTFGPYADPGLPRGVPEALPPATTASPSATATPPSSLPATPTSRTPRTSSSATPPDLPRSSAAP